MKKLMTLAAMALGMLAAMPAQAQKLTYDDQIEKERYLGTTYEEVLPRGLAVGFMSLSARVDEGGNSHYYLNLIVQCEDDTLTMNAGNKLRLRLKSGRNLSLMAQEDAKVTRTEHIISVNDKTDWSNSLGFAYAPFSYYGPRWNPYIAVPLHKQTRYYHHETHTTNTLQVFFEIAESDVQLCINDKVEMIRLETNQGNLTRDIKKNKFSKRLKKGYKVISKQMGKPCKGFTL